MPSRLQPLLDHPFVRRDVLLHAFLVKVSDASQAERMPWTEFSLGIGLLAGALQALLDGIDAAGFRIDVQDVRPRTKES